jgi:DNA-directed RNA polymerase specialized sigma24 family protein
VGQVTPVGESAFTKAWSAVAAQVSARCRGLARDWHEAQELYQLTAIRAWRGQASFRGESSYLTWVMRILDHEAARLASRRNRIASREVTVDPQAVADQLSANLREYDSDAESGGQESGGGETGWLAALLADAAASQVISAAEYRVMSARLADPGAAWPRIAAGLGMTATACAVAHSRAVPKLRVFLFTDRSALLGGDQAIADAFARVRRDQGAALTALEEEAFEHVVIRRSAGYRRRGSQAALRGACAKVARRMGLP